MHLIDRRLKRMEAAMRIDGYIGDCQRRLRHRLPGNERVNNIELQT